MKKVLFLLTFIVFAITISFSQSFEVYDGHDELINGETLTMPIMVNEDIEFNIKVKNTSGSQISAKISQSLQTTMIDGSEHFFCTPATINSPDGSCGSIWGTSTQTFVLDIDETSDYGHITFDQGPNPGITTIQYKVYDVNNESDFVIFTITFSTSTLVDFEEVNNFSVYPNPTVNSFTVSNNYGANSYVEIYNILGMQVSRVDFANTGLTEIDCSNWEKGYYFCRLYNNGKIEKTIKMTITH